MIEACPHGSDPRFCRECAVASLRAALEERTRQRDEAREAATLQRDAAILDAVALESAIRGRDAAVALRDEAVRVMREATAAMDSSASICEAARRERDAARAEAEALRAQNAAGLEDAARFARNADYYCGLLDAAAAHLGPEIYRQDDGGTVDQPLRAKVPELVAGLAAHVARLRAALLGAMTGDQPNERPCCCFAWSDGPHAPECVAAQAALAATPSAALDQHDRGVRAEPLRSAAQRLVSFLRAGDLPVAGEGRHTEWCDLVEAFCVAALVSLPPASLAAVRAEALRVDAIAVVDGVCDDILNHRVERLDADPWKTLRYRLRARADALEKGGET